VPVSLYIYYQIAPGAGPALLASLNAMQRDLEAHTGIVGRVMRRADDPDTWMEVYEAIEDRDAFELALTQGVCAFGIARFLAPGATRQVERFLPCA
jgi:hypothetical protein